MAGADEDALVGGGAHRCRLTQLDGAALLILRRVPQTEEPVHRGPAREPTDRNRFTMLCRCKHERGVTMKINTPDSIPLHYQGRVCLGLIRCDRH